VGTFANVIDVVLPVLDEVHALPIVIAGIPNGYHPIGVDNGSRDGSADCARRLGAQVVTEPRRGFGHACFVGLLASTTEVVCFMDCDGSLRGSDLPAVSDPVCTGDADLVLGARQAALARAWPWHSRIGNRVVVHQVRRRTGVRLRDLGPMRAAPRERLMALGIEDRRCGWPLEMVLRAARDGWRVSETTVAYDPRIGRSKVTGTVRGTAQAVRDMARVLA
jgi:glycosyltransferase involved in cell wall biosynthesis